MARELTYRYRRESVGAVLEVFDRLTPVRITNGSSQKSTEHSAAVSRPNPLNGQCFRDNTPPSTCIRPPTGGASLRQPLSHRKRRASHYPRRNDGSAGSNS